MTRRPTDGLPVLPRLSALACLTLLLTAAPHVLAEGKPEVYNATAALKTVAGASVTAPVVISISRWTTDAEREKVVGALKAGGTSALQKEIASMPDAGFLQVGEVKTPIHFARTLPVGGGKVVTWQPRSPSSTSGRACPMRSPRPVTTSRW